MWTTVEDSGDCLTDSSAWDAVALGDAVGVTVDPTMEVPEIATTIRMQAPEGCWFDIVAGKLLNPSSSLCRTNESGSDFVFMTDIVNGGFTQIEAIVVCCE